MDHYTAAQFNREQSSYTGIGFLFSCLLLFLSFFFGDARAENHRDFSAMYDIGPATAVDPTHVSVTLFLRFQNHSGVAVSNASISLKNILQPGSKPMPVASGILAQDHGTTEASGTVTVGINEYRQWQRGGQPLLLVRVPDRNGHEVDRPIELIRMAGVGAMR